MQFTVLGSGSKGNSVFVENNGTGLLIDNGFSGKELDLRLRKVGRSLDNVSAICITHEHGDHIKGVGVVSRRRKIPVYANPGTFGGAEHRLGKLHKRVEFSTGDKIEINGLEIHSFAVSHDTADPVGYVISDGSRYLGYCTDTGTVTQLMKLRLAGCHALILEFNHNLEMLKNGPYPLPLQQRVRSRQGHLSNEDGALLLKSLMHPKLRYAVLAHLSETNNLPRLAMDAAIPCFSKEYEAEMVVANQGQPTQLVSL
jgi:phosphoribosyl 1,2-cyclic phosphodiesterase